MTEQPNQALQRTLASARAAELSRSLAVCAGMVPKYSHESIDA
jgi:hypothetical protein